jgi:GDPmannose 4,6-dehydratase
VREFCEVAFAHLGLDYREWVKVDSELFRPADVAALVGDASKANRVLGWQHQVSWKDLIVEMVERDLEKAQVALRAQETFGWASAAVAS